MWHSAEVKVLLPVTENVAPNTMQMKYYSEPAQNILPMKYNGKEKQNTPCNPMTDFQNLVPILIFCQPHSHLMPDGWCWDYTCKMSVTAMMLKKNHLDNGLPIEHPESDASNSEALSVASVTPGPPALSPLSKEVKWKKNRWAVYSWECYMAHCHNCTVLDPTGEMPVWPKPCWLFLQKGRQENMAFQGKQLENISRRG